MIGADTVGLWLKIECDLTRVSWNRRTAEDGLTMDLMVAETANGLRRMNDMLAMTELYGVDEERRRWREVTLNHYVGDVQRTPAELRHVTTFGHLMALSRTRDGNFELQYIRESCERVHLSTRV